MKLPWPLLIATFLAALAQSVLPAAGILPGLRVPLLPATLLCFALKQPQERLLPALFFGAVLHDVFDHGPAGLSLPAFLTVPMLLNHIRLQIFAEEWSTQFVAGLLGTLLISLIYGLTALLTGFWKLGGVAFFAKLSAAPLGGLLLPLLMHLKTNRRAATLQRRGVLQ